MNEKVKTKGAREMESANDADPVSSSKGSGPSKPGSSSTFAREASS